MGLSLCLEEKQGVPLSSEMKSIGLDQRSCPCFPEELPFWSRHITHVVVRLLTKVFTAGRAGKSVAALLRSPSAPALICTGTPAVPICSFVVTPRCSHTLLCNTCNVWSQKNQE